MDIARGLQSPSGVQSAPETSRNSTQVNVRHIRAFKEQLMKLVDCTLHSIANLMPVAYMITNI